MTIGEAQANPYIVTCIMCVFGTLAQVLFDSRSTRYFVSYSFALHVDQELALLKNKLVVTTPLGEQILHISVFKGCEILVESVILKANLIPLEIGVSNRLTQLIRLKISLNRLNRVTLKR